VHLLLHVNIDLIDCDVIIYRNVSCCICLPVHQFVNVGLQGFPLDGVCQVLELLFCVHECTCLCQHIAHLGDLLGFWGAASDIIQTTLFIAEKHIEMRQNVTQPMLHVPLNFHVCLADPAVPIKAEERAAITDERAKCGVVH